MRTVNTYYLHLLTSQPFLWPLKSGFSCYITVEASSNTQNTLWPLILLMNIFFSKLFLLWLMGHNASLVPPLPLWSFFLNHLLNIWSSNCCCIPILQMRKMKPMGSYMSEKVTELIFRQLDLRAPGSRSACCIASFFFSPSTLSLSSPTHGLGLNFTYCLIVLKSILSGQLFLLSSKPVQKAC